MLNVFGDNVFTVGVNDWLRHRKAVARPLHDVTKGFIWHESLRQARYERLHAYKPHGICHSGSEWM